MPLPPPRQAEHYRNDSTHKASTRSGDRANGKQPLLLAESDYKTKQGIREIGLLPTDQIPKIIDAFGKFIAENGVFSAILLLFVLGVLLSIIMLLYVVLQLIKLQTKATDASAKRDERIDRVSTRVEDVQDKVAGVQEKLVSIIEPIVPTFRSMKDSMDANTELTRSTVTSYQTLEENVVKSYDAASIIIGRTGDDVKKNSDANTQKIIEDGHSDTEKIIAEVQQLAAPSGAIRSDIQRIALDIVDAFKSLDQKNNNLEIENQILRIANEKLITDAIETDPHPSEPLNRIPSGALSPVSGEFNRSVIDGDQPEPPTPGTKEPLPFEKPGDVLGKTGTDS